MFARLTVLAVLLMAGCQTPAELKQNAQQHDTMALLRTSPDKAAACLQRGYENMSSFLTTRLTPLGNDAYELVVRNDTLTQAVLEIRPGALEYWIDDLLTTVPKDQIRSLLARCR